MYLFAQWIRLFIMDFKKTLNNPTTSFDMRANLAHKEPILQKKWLDKNIYQKLLKKTATFKKRILHDGPPYANGALHVGHALNKILKDIIVRSWFLAGYHSPYVPGWDTHGLPIEHAVSTKISGYMKLSVPEKRKTCLEYAKQQIVLQKSQFQRFGLITDFKDCYYTFEPQFEQDQLNLFATMVKKGFIYRDLKPVYWSWSSRSALADAEIEYKDVTAHSIFVGFKIVEPANESLRVGDQLIIWTTTPWTIPTNQAINIHPKREYAVVVVNNQRYIVDAELVESIAKILNWTNFLIKEKLVGAKIVNSKYAHALYPDKINPVLAAEYVSANDGTGLVHSSPGFGLDDFYVCKNAGIKEVIVSIDDSGKFKPDFFDKELRELFYQDANAQIIERLKTSGALLHQAQIVHSEPHDWRTKKPVIYRATKQWFIRLDNVRNELIHEINKVVYQNPKHKKRISEMVATRAEWCISRQRVWGVPIPLLYDENNNPVMDPEIIDFTIAKIGENGTDAWFDENKPASFFVPQKYSAAASKWRKETDIMDVWFDSGCSFSTMQRRGIEGKVQLYLEGNDQYRGWFNSALICSVITRGFAPFTGLLSHGIVLDAKGNKMSKSLGNIIDPLDICARYGADILRLWVASIDYSEDSHIGNDIIEQVAEQYRRIRNTLLRFPLSNLADFDYQPLATYEFSLADLVTMAQINALVRTFDQAIIQYRYQQALKALTMFIGDLSGWYFDIAKDTLYCDAPNAPRRRATQAVLNYLLTLFLPRISAFVPHTAEEAYEHWNAPDKLESVLLHTNPPIQAVDNEAELLAIAQRFKTLKGAVYIAIERLRQAKVINKTNEAAVCLPRSVQQERFANELKQWLNVAEVTFSDVDTPTISQSTHPRCPRCWTHFAPAELDRDNLCARCAAVVAKYK